MQSIINWYFKYTFLIIVNGSSAVQKVSRNSSDLSSVNCQSQGFHFEANSRSRHRGRGRGTFFKDQAESSRPRQGRGSKKLPRGVLKQGKFCLEDYILEFIYGILHIALPCEHLMSPSLFWQTIKISQQEEALQKGPKDRFPRKF